MSGLFFWRPWKSTIRSLGVPTWIKPALMSKNFAERVESLLQAHAKESPFLDQPAVEDLSSILPAPLSSRPDSSATGDGVGTTIAGKYILRQLLGSGGMGTVYLAEQTQPVRREVAVKLINPGMDSRQVLSRFEAERQALAVLEHPHIAKVLDGGTTDAGRPFFVMELVRGISITQFCDTHHLSVDEPFRTFHQVCGAVHHAHQKGIIHRDLKPSNILVESREGQVVPKVIDFGLAKAIGGLTLTDQSFMTALGNLAGTPQYMAPEQASFNAIDIDTRADIYALGVVLYELLTGTTPLASESLRRTAMDEMLRQVREQEPPRPSSRVSTLDALPSIAANRQLEPSQLSRLIHGELDWIVLKALAKDRARRYDSAASFAADLVRFLNHEPVEAGPPSRIYRLRKFVRRHRLAVVAAGSLLVVLLAGIAGTSWGLLRAQQDAESRCKQKKWLTSRGSGHISALIHSPTVRSRIWLVDRISGEIRNVRSCIRFAINFRTWPVLKKMMPRLAIGGPVSHLRVGSVAELLGDNQAAEIDFHAAAEEFGRLASEMPQSPIAPGESGDDLSADRRSTHLEGRDREGNRCPRFRRADIS